MLDRIDETIVAVSSAPGRGPVGIVRLSGPGAPRIVDGMFHSEAGQPLSVQKGWTRHRGEVLIEAKLSVPACVYLFRAPHSYTRQDVVEIHTIGAPALLEMVRQRAIHGGAIAAEPGEFTARAFFSGGMDLARAEAVAAVIRAESDTQLRAARRMMDGVLADRIRSVRNELAELTALVEADIDFAEEPIEFITPADLQRRVSHIVEQLEKLLAGAQSVERFDVLPQILLFGPPNAGKSTLMNRLSGIPRAITAAVAGTTRDILSAPIRLGRGEAILLDGAGVEHEQRGIDGSTPRTGDDVADQARAMTLAAAERVDLLCVVVDLSRAVDARIPEAVRSFGLPAVLVGNKSDLLSAEGIGRCVAQLESYGLGAVCTISALTGAGLDELNAKLTSALGTGASTTLGESVLISARQSQAVRDALAAMRRCIALAARATETIECAELAAFELREALEALGSVTGEVSTEDLLGQVFANFCIGK